MFPLGINSISPKVNFLPSYFKSSQQLLLLAMDRDLDYEVEADLIFVPLDRNEYWRNKPSVDELVRIHYDIYRDDSFARVMYKYPWGRDTITNAIKERSSRKDYEFLLARFTPSNEIMAWIALSFDINGSEAENGAKCEAGLEWTEMCSHILKDWKVKRDGEKSNVWDTIKGASSNLQAKHLPANYCIINTLVIREGYERSGIALALLQYVIDFWGNRVMVGTEWAIWVQAPPVLVELYADNGFEEVGECEVDLGDYGFFSEAELRVPGKYIWKFMVLKEASGLATKKPDLPTKEPDAKRKQDKGKGKEQSREKPDKGKGKEQRLDNLQLDDQGYSEHGPDQTRIWEEAEERMEQIRTQWGRPPFIGEVAYLMKVQDKAEQRGADTTGLERIRERLKNVRCGPPRKPLAHPPQPSVEAPDPLVERLKNLRYGPLKKPLAHPPQRSFEVTDPPEDNYVPTKSEEDLVDLMRKGGVDEEEIEIVKALAFSMSEEATGG